MKKLITISTCMFLAFVSKATIRTVCNIPTPSAQFSTIQAAADASSSGDTILVQGSGTTYTAFTVQNKHLVIIGPGWNPLRNVPSLTAKVASGAIKGASSSGTEIQGLTFNSALTIDNTVSINNIRIIRNHFLGDLYIGSGGGTGSGKTYSGFLIESNWFDAIALKGLSTQIYSNFIIQNNVFYKSYIESISNATNILLDHNLFYAAANFSVFNQTPTNTAANFTIQNNIFCRATLADDKGGATNCTFKNNITFNGPATAPWTLRGNINGGGNVLNVDPQMTAQTQVNSGVNDPLLNFIITAGPANNKGTDGKDMGLLYNPTGSLNWINSRNSRLPYIFNITITNPNIVSGSSLNVTLEARKTN